jgi:hypothetical protein
MMQGHLIRRGKCEGGARYARPDFGSLHDIYQSCLYSEEGARWLDLDRDLRRGLQLLSFKSGSHGLRRHYICRFCSGIELLRVSMYFRRRLGRRSCFVPGFASCSVVIRFCASMSLITGAPGFPCPEALRLAGTLFNYFQILFETDHNAFSISMSKRKEKMSFSTLFYRFSLR